MNCNIQAGDRVALLGRVGSGKHTTLDILAGLTSHASLVSGRVYFDDIDVTFNASKYLGDQTYLLSDDFKMVEGTLRQNIDPQRSFTDVQILKVLNYLNFWKLNNRQSSLTPHHQNQDWDGIVDPFKQDDDAGTNEEYRRSLLSFHKHDTLMSIVSSSSRDIANQPAESPNKRQQTIKTINPIDFINKEISRLKGLSKLNLGNQIKGDKTDEFSINLKDELISLNNEEVTDKIVRVKEAEDAKIDQIDSEKEGQDFKVTLNKIKENLLKSSKTRVNISEDKEKLKDIDDNLTYQGKTTKQIIDSILRQQNSDHKLSIDPNVQLEPTSTRVPVAIFQGEAPYMRSNSKLSSKQLIIGVLECKNSNYIESVTQEINSEHQFADLTKKPKLTEYTMPEDENIGDRSPVPALNLGKLVNIKKEDMHH